MKALYLDWPSFGGEFIKEAFIHAGVALDVEPFLWQGKNIRKDEQLTMAVTKKIIQNGYDFVFTNNYFPIVAMACLACRTLYFSWIYDSPHIVLFSKTISFPTNRIFVFDRQVITEILACYPTDMPKPNLYHLPLAGAPDYYKKVISSNFFSEKYQISFVGSTYKDNMFLKLDSLDTVEKENIMSLIKEQQQTGYHKIIENKLTKQQVGNLEKCVEIVPHPDGFESVAWVYANYFLYRELTSIERTTILKKLSNQYEVNLFTKDKKQDHNNIIWRKSQDYYKESPNIFKNSDININITLRSIGTGIPLRCFDILSCEGFLITNRQEELEECFRLEKEIITYDSQEELVDKVNYYMIHESERKKIAEQGFRSIMRQHTYKDRISKMLKEL